MAFPSAAKLQHLDGGVVKTFPASSGAIDADKIRVNEIHVNAGGVAFRNAADSADIFELDNAGAHSIGATGQIVTFPGSVTITQDLIVSGTRTTINSTVVEIDDNIQQVNSGPSGSSNAGFSAARYQVANDAGTGDVVTDPAALLGTIVDIGDQTGVTSVQVKLAGGSATNSYYVGDWLVADNGETRLCTGYNGTTKIATIASAWVVQPADGEDIEIYTPVTGLIYNESSDRWVVAHLNSRAGGDAILDHGPFQAGALFVDDLATLTGGASLPDSANLVLGTGSDLTLVHDGTNSSLTNVTGNLLFDLAHAGNGAYINAQLGVDNNTQAFRVLNNSGTAMLSAGASGTLTLAGDKTLTSSGGALIVAGGSGGYSLSLRGNGTNVANGLDVTQSSGVRIYQHLVPYEAVGPGVSDSALDVGTSSAAFRVGYFDTLTSLDANFAVTLGSTTVAPKVASMTTIQRDALTPAVGMIIYNSTESRFEGYENGAWAVLVNAAPSLTGITGTTNISYTVNSDGGGSADEDATLYLISDTGANKDTGSLTYVAGVLGGSDRSNFGTWSFGAAVKIADSKQLIFGTDSDANISWDNGGSLLDVNVTGTAEIDASGGVSIEASGGALNFGADDVDQNVNVGTDGERAVVVGSVNGAASLALRAGSGNFVVTAGGILDLNVTGAATLDAASFSIDSTGASNVSVTGANLSLGTLTSGTLGLSSAGAATFDAASSVTIGGTNATSLDLSRSGQMTTVKGTLNVDEAVTLDSKLTASGDVVVALGKSLASSGWTTTDCAVGEVVYASAASTVSLADADNSSASKIIGVINAAGEVVHCGPCSFHLDAGGCAAGDRLYASPTAGRVTATAPSTATQYVAPVGIALAIVAANDTGRGIFMREPATLLS